MLCWRKMNQCVFLAGLRLQLPTFKEKNRASAIRPQISRFIKTYFHAVSKLYEELLGHSVPFHEKKRTEKSVLWVLTVIPVLILIRWNCLNSQLEVASKLFLSETRTLDKIVVMKKNWTSVFFWQVSSVTLQLSQVRILLLPSSPNSHVNQKKKKKVYQQFQSCVNTHKTQYTIPC